MSIRSSTHQRITLGHLKLTGNAAPLVNLFPTQSIPIPYVIHVPNQIQT